MVTEAPAEAAAGPGKRVGRYLLRYLVAEGGMASVYLAQLPGPHGFEKWVAVKVMHRHLARNRRFVRMFLDEGRLAARINHPNVCSVLDFGEDEAGVPYLVLEYLHGETLSAVLRRGKRSRPPKWLVARIVADAARGLHAAHELRSDDDQPLGVVHRDVSPQNITVLYDGLSKVLDFGIARLRGRVGQTKSGEIKGKLRYMSPEQLKRKVIDRRTDVWALGVVLWEATVGRRLFRADNEGAVVLDVLEGPIPRPAEAEPGFPPVLEAAIMKALEREPDDRYPTAAALADDIERYLYSAGEPAGLAQVGDWMRQVFADRLSARDALLRAPPLPVDTVPEVNLGSLGGAEEVTLQGLQAGPTPVTPVQARPRRGPLLLAVALVAVFFAVFGGVLAVGRGRWAGRRDERHAALGPGTGTTVSEPRSADSGGSEGPTAAPAGDAGPSPAKLAPDVATAPGRGDAALAGRDASTPRRGDGGASDGGSREKTRPQGSGRLNLLAIPAAEVFLRGRSLGRTPLFNAELPAGRHRLTLRPLAGGTQKTIVVTIRPGETLRKSVSL
jgi:serine/threonine-protein kinase